MEVRSRRARETSPDRAKLIIQPRPNSLRKVQVVYYLTRNGQLEHPHYTEVTHLATQHLRLKDVMDRLIALRGKAMPSLYSWSCKRSYRNGYVWNDLTENDVIYPSEGAEYVLKGSELLEGCTEKFQQINVSNAKSKQAPSRPRETEKYESNRFAEQEYYNNGDEYEEYEYLEKTSCTSSTTPHSRCSRGVSTDELETQKNTSELTLNDSSPPSTSPPLVSVSKQINSNLGSSKRFEDGDPLSGTPSRNSVLLQLIACGGGVAASKAKTVPGINQACNRKSESLQKVVLSKNAVKVEDDMNMIRYMSENPRFGNFQSEEKEYFSGSIVVEAMAEAGGTEPVLKKSNSYNEERSCKAVLGEAMEVEKREEKMGRGRCIPLKKSCGGF